MSPLSQEIDTDCIESEEAIYQRLKVWSTMKMTREGSDGQTDMAKQYCDHGGIQCQYGVSHHRPIFGGTVLYICCGQG